MKKVNWGLIGGGEGSQIGFTHRAAAGLDGRCRFEAGALDVDPGRAKTFGMSLGLEPDRAYGSWQEMLAGEKSRDDRCELVSIATPNLTHYEISKAFLEAGFHVLCEKPMTLTVEEAKGLVDVAAKTDRVCAVNYGYSGYPMVRQMRAMVTGGELGAVRVVVAEFAGGFMADAADADNPRVRWRFDRNQAGVAAVTFDCGTHALHLACFVTGERVTAVTSDFVSGIEGRELEDDNLSAFRMSSGAAGRLWTSGLAIGRTHGLTLQVFGESGGLRWVQEQPNQLFWTPLNEPTRVLERGGPCLSPLAYRANRITVGHPEGFVGAVANVYSDLLDVITARREGVNPAPLSLTFPTVEDGRHSVEVVHAMAASASKNGQWIDL